jgi:methyltransferase (TIGR00027 family)
VKVRTEFIDDVLSEALRSGVSQVAILGAGYDCRALQQRKPGVSFFELDHPVTQEDKKRRLTELGICPEGVAYLPLDFRIGSVGGSLARSRHWSPQPSLFICEGLLLYLSDSVVRLVFQSIAEQAVPGSVVVLTARIEQEKARSWRSRLVGLGRWMTGEPERSHYCRDELVALLRSCGFSPVRESFSSRSGPSSIRTLMVTAVFD